MGKKILFISHYSELYGANKSLLSLIQHFDKKKYEIKVLLPSKGGLSDKLEELKISNEVIPFFSSFLYLRIKLKYFLVPILILMNIITLPIIIYRVNKFDPDLIYSNSSAENIGILIAKFLGKKHITHIREFMEQHYKSFFIFGRNAKRRFFNNSDGIIFVSNALKDDLKFYGGITALNTVIYNGVTIPKEKVFNVELPKKLKFGIVGILDPGKGHHIAIRYFARILENFPNAELHIIGDSTGSYKKNLISLVKVLELKQSVFFHGYMKNQSEIYSIFDILLVFSKFEGFGRVTVEAMMRGKPVIGLNNAGTSELINNGKTGFLFENEKSFEDSIFQLVKNSDKYNSIRVQAYQNAISNCNIDKYGNNVEKFVNQIINKPYHKKSATRIMF